jgi:antitoxin ParD1/3/4
MNITLTAELEEIIQAEIASGLYSSATEVVREALCLIAARDRFLESQRESLRRDVQAGLKQLDRGEFVTPTPNVIMDSVDARLKRAR